MNTAKRKHRPGTLFILIGPSGVGKNAIQQALLRKKHLRLRRVTSMTTRAPRPGETEGVSYFFVDNKRFDETIKQSGFLNWEHIQTSRYGIPRHPTVDQLRHGENLIIHIDVKGADDLRKQKLNLVSIFVSPASFEELKKRLLKRRFLSKQERDVRLGTALKEMKRMNDFDYRVVNVEGKLKETIRQVEKIILSQK